MIIQDKIIDFLAMSQRGFKCVRQECLTPATFLTTRVHVYGIDDLLIYVLGTRDRGIVFDIGDENEMKVHEQRRTNPLQV